MLKLALLLVCAVGVARPAAAVKAADPITATANMDKGYLADRSAGMTSAAIQAAAGGGTSAGHAAAVGNAATSVVSLSTGALAMGRDMQNQQIQLRTQDAIRGASSGSKSGPNPADAAAAIRTTQAVATGSTSAGNRQQMSTIDTQAAVQSGDAVHATKTGAAGASLVGGTGGINPAVVNVVPGPAPKAPAQGSAPGAAKPPAAKPGVPKPPAAKPGAMPATKGGAAASIKADVTPPPQAPVGGGAPAARPAVDTALVNPLAPGMSLPAASTGRRMLRAAP